jgi:hypothetical protein
VVYISTCLLLDPFQLYLEMSLVFGLSIYTATANSCTVGNENVLLGFFVGEGDCNQNVGLRVIREKMKICSCLYVVKNPYPHDVS